MNRKVSFARAFIALITAGLLAAPLMAPAAQAAECNSDMNGSWVSIYPKKFPHGSSAITNHAVDPLSTDTFFITNGTSVMRTTEFDCNFKEIYVLPESAALGGTEPTAADSTIESIEIAEQLRVLVLLAVEQRVGDAVRPHIVRSEDGGNTWTVSDTGLPPTGAIDSLALAPSNPLIAYLGIDVNGGSVDLLYATTDGGTTWTLRSNVADAKPQANIEGFVVDPTNADVIWAHGNTSTQAGTGAQVSGLLRSTDGGQTFQNIEEFAQDPVGVVDVAGNGSTTRIMAFRRLQGDAQVSLTGGDTWSGIASPQAVDSVAHGRNFQEVAVTSAGRVYAYHPLTFSWLDLGVPHVGAQHVQADRQAFRFTAHTARTLEVFLGELDDPPVIPDRVFDVPLITTPKTPERFPPTLTPEARTVRLDPGDSKTVRYRLDIARRPLPLNVFFLLDTSDSMGGTIEDLAKSTANIINELGDEYISLKVGIGAFRAYPDKLVPDRKCDDGPQVPTSARCEANYVYLRIHDIATPTAAMSESLRELDSDAGGFYKSHLGALYQLATGEGQDIHPPGPSEHDVPQGLQANFDAKALRVVIHATDEAFGRPVQRNTGGSSLNNPDPPDIPSNAEVAAALNARDIMQIGLSIGRGPREDLKEVAADTGALAPAGGVDCDGDGHKEVEAGQPLVCDVTRTSLMDDSTNLVPAIISLLEAVPPTTRVALDVKGNDDVVRKVAPEVHTDIVLQTANKLLYDVTFRCPLTGAGKEFSFDLVARSEGRVLDRTTARVTCNEEPPPVPALLVFGLLPPPLIPAPPPPPPTQISSTTQAQGQAQAQAGAATQEEEQPQVAMAAAYKEILEEKMAEALEYEMTAYEPRRDPVSPVLVLTAGLIMGAAAYGYTVARERVQIAFQRR